MTSLASKQAEWLDACEEGQANFMQNQEDDTEDRIELKDFLPEGSALASDFAICGDTIIAMFLPAADEAKTQYEDIYGRWHLRQAAGPDVHRYANVPGNPRRGVKKQRIAKLGSEQKVFHG